MAQGADFRSRISIEGGKEVIDLLKQLATAAEKSFGDFGKAAEAPVSPLGRLQTALKTTGDAAKKLGQDLTAVKDKASAFGASMSNIAGNIFPHFKEVLGILSVGGVAGFFKMVEATAQWGHELKVSAETLGLSVDQMTALSKAAKQAGVETDHLIDGIARFGTNLENAADKQRGTITDLVKAVDDATSGHPGGVIDIPENLSAKDQKYFADALSNIDKFRNAARDAYNVANQAGVQLASSFEEWFNKVELGIRTRGADAKKIIQELNKLGADVQIGLPGQQLEQQITKAADVFTKLGIPVFDATGKVRGLTDAFGDFLDKFKDKSATEQLQLVRQALGRGFTDLIPLMRQGRDGMKAFFDELRGRGLDVSPFTQEVEEADKLHRALIRLDSAIKGIRKAFVLPFAKVFAPLVESLEQSLTSMKGQINDFAQSSAETLLAFAQDVKRVFQGQEPLTEAGRAFKIVADAMKVAVEALSLAFNALAAALQPIAGLLNGILGLNFDTRTYAIAAAVLYLTGVIPGLVAAFNLLRAVFLFFMANPIVAVFTALAAAGLIIYQNWDKIGPLFQTLWDELKEFGSQLYTDFVQPWVDAWDFVSQKYTESVESIKKDVQTVLDIFDGLITKAQVAANAVASVFGVDLGGSANYGGGSNYATGGLVSGPGGPTSDSVLARLSDGEYVMRAAAVKHWGPSFMAALNALRNPLGGYSLGGMVRSPRLLPRFAGGGMVTATTGDGVTVNLHFPGGAFALRGDKSIVQGLTREARRAGMLSAGRLPGVAVA